MFNRSFIRTALAKSTPNIPLFNDVVFDYSLLVNEAGTPRGKAAD